MRIVGRGGYILDVRPSPIHHYRRPIRQFYCSSAAYRLWLCHTEGNGAFPLPWIPYFCPWWLISKGNPRPNMIWLL